MITVKTHLGVDVMVRSIMPDENTAYVLLPPYNERAVSMSLTKLDATAEDIRRSMEWTDKTIKKHIADIITTLGQGINQ